MSGSRKAEAARWFRQARYDLQACRWNIQGGFHDTASFLAQQVAEKALKSLLYYLGARRKALVTHSLVEMIGEAKGDLPALEKVLEGARELDLHHIPSRYPNGLPSGYPHAFYGKETAERAAGAAERIIDVVTGHYEAEKETDVLSEPPAS